MNDLFGLEIPKPPPKITYFSRLKRINPMVIKHGIDKEDRRCKDCVHIRGFKQAASWHRCMLRNGGKGDHKANWEACSKFESGDSGGVGR